MVSLTSLAVIIVFSRMCCFLRSACLSALGPCSLQARPRSHCWPVRDAFTPLPREDTAASSQVRLLKITCVPRLRGGSLGGPLPSVAALRGRPPWFWCFVLWSL